LRAILEWLSSRRRAVRRASAFDRGDRRVGMSFERPGVLGMLYEILRFVQTKDGLMVLGVIAIATMFLLMSPKR
jgi:hypothetical protein